jgi:hypothetical protein
MPRGPVLVGSRSFALKKDVEQVCREILYRYEPGSRVIESADEQFLLDLLELHPQQNEKFGGGVAHFEVRANPRFVRQRTFYLVRVDGSETDFSFMKCLRPPSHRQLVMGAMRHEVSNQVYEFAEAAYSSGAPVLCAVTGQVILRTEAHVDHSSPTFLELAEQFVIEHGGWDEMVIARADGLIGVQLGHEDQARAWRDCHRRRASLRIVSVQANLSLLRRGPRASDQR